MLLKTGTILSALLIRPAHAGFNSGDPSIIDDGQLNTHAACVLKSFNLSVSDIQKIPLQRTGYGESFTLSPEAEARTGFHSVIFNDQAWVTHDIKSLPLHSHVVFENATGQTVIESSFKDVGRRDLKERFLWHSEQSETHPNKDEIIGSRFDGDEFHDADPKKGFRKDWGAQGQKLRETMKPSVKTQINFGNILSCMSGL